MNVSYNLLADLPAFLAYSLELEKEAAERLRQFAARMEVHEEPALAATFDRLAAFSEQHAQEVQDICKNRDIPLCAAGGLTDEIVPETTESLQADTAMTVREAVAAMLTQEGASADFYADVARRTVTPEIREFALEFAEEENEHARALEKWLNGSGN